MSLRRGATLGNYRIIEAIGAGGMGEVYRARDTRLERNVAIKILSEDVSHDSERLRRFGQEARAASSLNHPNIVTIYEIGAHEGLPYIAMEYVEGVTLRQYLEAGPLPEDALLRYARQLAEGLAKAHQARIVHRDLKPENVLISTDGYVKILDFGLAKLGPQPDLETDASTMARTTPGAILGTPSYMSPEQARGETVDHRSDQFAFGAILYEMCSGQRAFHEQTATDTLSAVLRDDPPSGRLPASTRAVVERCLSKRAEERYESTAEILEALRLSERAATTSSRSAVGATESRKSIVVLPFHNMSPDPNDTYFSDGLTEEIITDLSHLRSLRVISLSSAMALKDSGKDVRTIGRELDVEYVLEGSVRKAGESLRISAQLIDARTDEHLWAERYDGVLDNVFEIQENTSRSIVRALNLTLAPEEDRRIAEHPIEDPRAFACHLQATAELRRMSEDSIKRAIQLTRNGLDLVGNNELLFSTMGEAYLQQIMWGTDIEGTVLEKARDCKRRAFALDAKSRHGTRLAAMIAYHVGNKTEAARLFKEVLTSDPNDTNALTWLISLYVRVGKAEPARELADRLVSIDPLIPVNHSWKGWLDFFEGEGTELLLEPNRRMHEMDPDSPYGQWVYSLALAYNRRTEELRPLLERLARDAPGTSFGRLAVLLRAGFFESDTSEIESVSEELKRAARFDDATSWFLADCYSLLGRIDDALEYVDSMIRLGGVNYPILSQSPLLENARRDPRFRDRLQHVRELWNAFDG